MTDELNPSILPDTLSPAPLGPLSGNWHDDDADAYAQDFASITEGPQPTAGVPHAKDTLPVETRVISSRATIGTSNGVAVLPIMLLPSDRNRKALTIQLMGTANGDLVTIASSKTGCYNDANAQAGVAPQVISLDGHTGALWVYSVSANAIVASCIAVTQ